MSTITPGTHLTDAQFTDLLLGAMSPQVSAHLDGCTTCAAEVRKVSAAIGTFEQQSRLWAERRASAQQPLTAPARPRWIAWLQRPTGIAAWSTATAAAALVLSASLGLRHLETAPRPVPASASVVPAATALSPAKLKADNELLYAIDGELQADTTPPASVYGLQAADHVRHAPAARRISN